MHIGFIVQELTGDEIKKSYILVSEEDKEMFPKEGVLFFIESYNKNYGCHIDSQGKIIGLEGWYKSILVAKEDIVIISKYSEGYFLSTLSEIVEQQQHFIFEMDRILAQNCHI